MSAAQVGVRVAYGAAFCLLLPALLLLWALATADLIAWPLPLSPRAGALTCAAGLVLMVVAIVQLRRHGGGLPMNAFPPERLVRRGLYAWLAHPIYLGFAIAGAGAAAWAESPSGFYLVAPAAAAGAAALVLGYEGPALRARFRAAALVPPLLSLPVAGAPLRWHHRLAVVLLVLLPWLLLYELVVWLGPAGDAVTPFLPGERDWPVWQWTYLIYASAYPVVGLLPFAVAGRDGGALGDFARAGLWATAMHLFLYAVLPIAAPPRPFAPASALGELLAFEADRERGGAGAFPSFHVTWTCLAAALAGRTWPRLRLAAWAWAAAVAASCATTGMHAAVDVPAGFGTFLLVHRRRVVYARLRALAERVANSWREWRLGPVRLIVHGAYASIAAAWTTAVMGWLLGAEAWPPIAVVCATALAGAALWAQWVEGASLSLRPFGYYGAVLGAAAGGLVVLPLLGQDPWPVLGALSAAAPIAQAIGRLRCLVQGCCHGHPVAPSAAGTAGGGSGHGASNGIVFRHPRSRAVRLANLGGVPLHPTQLYSILWNVPCGWLLLRLCQVGWPPSAIAGLYLLLNGLGRFVEERFRGEPNTPVRWGLPIYQWLATASVAAGALCTAVPSAWPALTAVTAAEPAPAHDARLVWLALGFGLFTAAAMGVDFPDSDRRFARLVK